MKRVMALLIYGHYTPKDLTKNIYHYATYITAVLLWENRV
jgi:hypothetical protein